jgi:hypothetical protein
LTKTLEQRRENVCTIFLFPKIINFFQLPSVASTKAPIMFLSSKRDDEDVHGFKDEFMHEPIMHGYKLVAPPQGLHVSGWTFCLRFISNLAK